MISSERKEDWIENTLDQLQGVMEQLNEIIKTTNSIEEVEATLSSVETREFSNERTNRFDIRNDVEFDNQEESE
jgi:hypothetical protein